VLLGFDNAADYAEAGGAFGALPGRNSRRVAGCFFKIDDQSYSVGNNEGGSPLHGVPFGFDELYWQLASMTVEASNS
jgi:aldose 1-epimerase